MSLDQKTSNLDWSFDNISKLSKISKSKNRKKKFSKKTKIKRGVMSREDQKRFWKNFLKVFWRLKHQITQELREWTFDNILILYLSWLIHLSCMQHAFNENKKQNPRDIWIYIWMKERLCTGQKLSVFQKSLLKALVAMLFELNFVFSIIHSNIERNILKIWTILHWIVFDSFEFRFVVSQFWRPSTFSQNFTDIEFSECPDFRNLKTETWMF